MRVKESLRLFGVPVRKPTYIGGGERQTLYGLGGWLGDYTEVSVEGRVADDLNSFGTVTHSRPVKEDVAVISRGNILGADKKETILTNVGSTYKIETRVPGLVHLYKAVK